MTATIRLDGVSVRFGDRIALDDVSCDLTARRIAVIGANGSGKSTFARLLNGLVIASAGRVLINDLDPARQKRDVRRSVGFVFCNPDAQIVMPTVSEDLAFSLRNRGLYRCRDQRASRQNSRPFRPHDTRDRAVFRFVERPKAIASRRSSVDF